MRQHVDILGWLYIGMGVLCVAIAVLVGGGMGAIGLLSGDRDAAAGLGVIGAFVAVFVSLMAVPSLVGGWGLLKRKHWARILVLILSFFQLFGFPVGTLIGAYGFWVLMNDEVKAML